MKLKWFLILLFVVIAFVFCKAILSVIENKSLADQRPGVQTTDSTWVAPSLYTDFETTGKQRELVMYGEQLVAHTSRYFGPKGSVSKSTNGMNCQNCHLDAGTRPWGNNFGAVFSLYPQYRARSNSIQKIYDRVNDCFERSLNGKAIDTGSLEMQAIYTYIKWLGKNVPSGKKPAGAGLPAIQLIDRAADAAKGNAIYLTTCKTCHGGDGEGVLNASGDEYIYPPLWGKQSYNDGAGLYRLSSFAAFVHNNMPYKEAHAEVLFSTEDSWDVAAYVNSMPHPHIDQSKDWPDLSKKAFDAPLGPYPDHFSEIQHKYGPFTRIVNASKINQSFTGNKAFKSR